MLKLLKKLQKSDDFFLKNIKNFKITREKEKKSAEKTFFTERPCFRLLKKKVKKCPKFCINSFNFLEKNRTFFKITHETKKKSAVKKK